MFEFLLDPNIAYLVLVVTALLVILALFSPGTGFVEVAAGLGALLSAYMIFNLPFNWWALIILLVGVIPFLIALRQSRRLIYLGISWLALVVGSAFLFRGETWQPAVNPILALIVTGLITGFLWFTARKSLEAMEQRPAHDLDTLIGAVGESRSPIHKEGSVQIGSELWSATSLRPIPSNTRVRVLRRRGFTLEVEPVTTNPEQERIGATQS